MISIAFFSIHPGRVARNLALFVCVVVWTNYPLLGGVTADGLATPDGKSMTAATAEDQTEEYKNWIELGIGGVITRGDTAQFEQEHRIVGDELFGGIQDLHYEQTVGKNATLAVDGHALWDINDYDLKIDLSQPKLGYIRAGFTEFRSWYDGNGGFFPPNGQFFSPRFPEMHIDRGEAWVELGLRVPDWPEITLRYSHEFRDGQKDSTIWGDTNLTGPTGVTRKIVPAFRNIDETRDIFALDASKTIGNTDVLLGMRYEHNNNDDSLNMERGAGQLPPVVPPPGAQRFVTQHQKDDVDLFSGHAITETRLTDSLWFTDGYSYTTLANDLSGTRIFGTDFDTAFGKPVPTLAQRDHAFIDLAGTAEVKEHVINANLFWMPVPHLTVLTAFRYTHENRDSEATFLAVEPERNTAPFSATNPQGGFHAGPPEPASGARSSDYDRFAERMELRYDGIANWLFYVQAEWEEEFGHVNEFHPDEEVPLNKDTDSLGQKYTVGANWYPLMRMNVSGQYYHKIASYGDDIISASFPRLIDQDWNTDDVNVRITFRPKIPTCLGTLSLVTRYDFVRTTIDGRWEIFSDGELLDEQQTGVITKHVISESINWSPLARFYLQTDISYVLDQTDTPASGINLIPNTSPTVLDFKNDYWTLTAATGYILDDKTDLHAEYTFYRANDYFNNSSVGLPYGMSASEHTASASLSRQLRKNVRLLLKYTYYNYTDETFGGHNNYEGHSIFSSLQFRF
jgi:hypothetical protein